MGKSTSKIIEELVIGGWPRRYVVTNTRKVILVTYDFNHAKKIADSIKVQEDPSKFFVKTK